MNDFNDIDIKLGNLPFNILEKVAKAQQREAKRMQGEVKFLVRVDTGGLRDSVYEQTDIIDMEVESLIGSNHEAAIYNEFGTGPVGQASAKNLPDGLNVTYTQEPWTYKSPKNGKFYTTSGMEANPAFTTVAMSNKDKVNQAVKQAVKDALKG